MALEHLLPTLGLAAAAALRYGLLPKSNPAFALLLSLAAGLASLARLTVPLQQMAAGLAARAARVDGAAFASLLRCAGVLLLTDYACAVCKEAEAEALAWCTSFAGRVLTLAALRDTQVDMFTTVFIGNSQTKEVGGRMVTPRGYRL